MFEPRWEFSLSDCWEGEGEGCSDVDRGGVRVLWEDGRGALVAETVSGRMRAIFEIDLGQQLQFSSQVIILYRRLERMSSREC